MPEGRPEPPGRGWTAGDHRHDFEKENGASKAGRVDPRHSRRRRLLLRQQTTHTGPGWLPQLHLARTNNERDSQLRDGPNAGRRGRKLQTTWAKGLTGQLQPIPAEPLSQTEIKALFAPGGFAVKPNKPELTGAGAATASDETASPLAPPGNTQSYRQLLRLQDIGPCQTNPSQATLQNKNPVKVT